MARAFVTGISGQDGSYLAELLLDKGYEVHGLVRDGRLGSAEHLRGQVTEHAGDLRDADSLRTAVADSGPDEVYHLAAETSPSRSREDREGTLDIVAAGTERLLEAVAAAAPEARFFYAASSEVFGKPERAPQDERTPIAPRNPYGDAKVEALEAVTRFRDERGLWAAIGIFYNHESPRRPMTFVTRKVTWHAAAIALGQADELRLGNLDARRDWGYAPEYVDGAWRALQASQPRDYVFATGILHSVRDLVEVAFARAGVEADGRVVVDEAFVRPEPPVPIVGDAGRARDELGWQASTPFEELIAEMVDHDMELLSS